MDKIGEKFNKFSHMVMKEADEKKKEIIGQAEQTKKETLSLKEMQYLKQAYERIQDAVHKLDKEINEEVSKAILESKQALFNRRDEIMEAVFQNVRARLADYKKQDTYKAYMENQIRSGLSQVGSGDIFVLADEDDLALLEELRASGLDFRIAESDEQLLGGCLVVNKEKGLLCDYSFISRLNDEKAAFLHNYKIGIE